jgi:suppressor for copper-sensitivity B
VLDKDTKKDEKNWLNLTNVNIKNMIKENKIVFVDITADWCATCQFNKINVINSKKIKKVFKDNNIVKVRGDWTKPNQQIREYLDSYKRFGIPFNILYNASYPEGIILSELLTKSEIIDTIEILKKDKN